MWNGAELARIYVSPTSLVAVIPASDLKSPGKGSVTVENPTPGGGTSSAISFTITAVPSNPAPTLLSISPASAKAGSAATTITLTGTNFVSASEVLWDGAELPATYVSSTRLTAIIPSALLTSSGSSAITVSTPGPGGGVSKAATFTIQALPVNPVPVLTSLSTSSVSAGSPGLTLTLSGANFIAATQVLWNGALLASSYEGAKSLVADIPASLLQSAGTATITVSNPAPGGGVSSALTFTIKAAAITVVNLAANDLAWDAQHGNLYLSLPAADGANGNSVQIVDPATGALGASAFAGSEPNLLSVSSSGKYLYVSLNSASSVQRMSLPGLGADISISLGSSSFYGPYYAMDLQAAPNADETVAVVRGNPGYSPQEEGGVLIYDNATSRPNVLCGWIEIPACPSKNNVTAALYDSIQWNANGTEMYAANNEDTSFDFYSVVVNASGFGAITDDRGLVQGFNGSIHFDPTTHLVYDDNGVVINPAKGTAVGNFESSGLMVPDGKLGTAFFLGQTGNNAGGTTYTLESFNLERFTPITTLDVENVVGTPTHLIRWGADGLAFTTGGDGSGAVYIIRGAFVSKPPAVEPAIPRENVHNTWSILRKLGEDKTAGLQPNQ
jgi:hypothetical protein